MENDLQSQAVDLAIKKEIIKIKSKIGRELVILTHHYQRKEIVDIGDYTGDSFALSKKAAEDLHARYIVFCGVHFMAESAAILAGPHQTVQIPELSAGCWMADMVDIYMVEKAWEAITAITGEESVTPIVYVNSDAQIKAFCGKHGGITCTSSNAGSAFDWGLARREKILFLPDQHLGRNTANRLGISAHEMIVWNPEKPLGGNTPENIRKARVILWDSYCLVHTRFRTDHIQTARDECPEARIVVHPECAQEVVAMADAVGSTGFIVNYVANAPKGATIFIGTEINLVHRLSLEHPDKKVMPLYRSLCPNMFKINLANLLLTLENIGRMNVVTVPETVKGDARLALERMLTL